MKNKTDQSNFKYIAILGYIFILLLQSCGNSDIKDYKFNPAFKKYITGFTTGEISAQAPIKIVFTQPYGKEQTFNQPIKEELFTFSSSVKGKTVWIDPYTITFYPKKPFTSGKIYWVYFALDKITKLPSSDLSTFKFPIKIIDQALNFITGGLKSYTGNSFKYYQFTGKIYTADITTPKELNKLVKIEINGGPKQGKWEKIPHKQAYRLVVDSVPRLQKEGEIVVKWNTQPYGDGKDKKSIQKIPALGDFIVMSTHVTQAPEQCITLQFSDPIAPQQDISGLIEVIGISGKANIRTTISTNEINVYPNQRLEGNYSLIVHKGIENIKGNVLEKSKRLSISFRAIKPDVKFVGKGNILPSSNNMVIPFMAVNLKAIDVSIIKIYDNNIQQFFQNNNFNGNRNLKRVGRLIRKKTIYLGKNKPVDLNQWNRFNLDLSQFITVDQGAIYRVVLNFRKYQSLYPCTTNFHEEITADSTDYNIKANNTSKDWNYTKDWQGDYYFNDYFEGYRYARKNNPCSNSYYRDQAVYRNIFASDIGIIAECSIQNSVTTIVTDLVTAQPIEQATVEIYDYQQQLLTTLKTNKEGIAQSTPLPFEPFFIKVDYKGQNGYLRLGKGNALPMSNFDIGGHTIQDGIKGFIYGERGVWRPGDTLFLNFILEDKDHIIPDNHPVIFELLNAKGQLVSRKVSTHAINGFYNFTTPTKQDAPTGNWLAKVAVGGATFTKNLKIETIKPNRLKIDLKIDKKQLSIQQNSIKGKLKVNWLHGAPASNLKTDIKLNFVPAPTEFNQFKNYTFDDPSKDFSASPINFIEGQLSEDGKLNFDKSIKVQQKAPGMLKAVFTTRAYEKGGSFSIDRTVINYAPYSVFVGIKKPHTNTYGALETDSTYHIPVVSVDAKGNRVKNQNLQVNIYKIDWSWWWENGKDNIANYVVRHNKTPFSTSSTTTNEQGKGKLTVEIPKYAWGRYFIQVVNLNSGHSTGMLTYFDWPMWMSRAGRETPGNANMLMFSSDKKNYITGEEAKISFPSSEGGQALISIENGKKVLRAYWITTQEGETQFEIPITPELAPNFYVHITFIQPHIHTKNDAPIRMYGVIPILVKDPNTFLEPVLKMPDELHPNSDFIVTVSEKNDKAMTYTIAVVDEGLLDLTNFKTPDPWHYFYSREALGVKTWDLYDYVIGAYGAKVENMLTIGGDENLQKGKKQPLRFKPMVKFIGPFTLKAGDEAQHKIHIPNYIGAVRTMIVAGQNGAYGNAEKTTPVRTPLMVMATLPRVLGPKETVQLPINLFAMKENIKNVTVQVKTNDKIQIIGQKTQHVKFDRMGNKVIYFHLEVGTKIGNAHIEVIATSGKNRATQTIDLQIRQPNLPVTVAQTKAISAHQSWTSSLSLPGMDRSNTAQIELSSLPPIRLQERLGYLIRYPHGCIEQKTSGAFPQLFLDNLISLDASTKKQIDYNIKSVINRIRNHQLSNGGLSFWAGGNKANEWATTYAGNFLLEAEKKGYALPYGMKDKWIDFQKSVAKHWSANKYGYHQSDLDQAYRLYTLALAKSPVLSAMNRLRHYSELSVAAAWRLAAAYQIIGKHSVAKAIVAGKSTKITPYNEWNYTFGSNYRDEAMIIETLTLMGEKSKAAPLVKDLSKVLSSSRWLSTQTTAYCLMAIAKFVKKNNPQTNLSLSYLYKGKTYTVTSENPIELIDIPVEPSQKNIEITIKNNASGYLFARIIGKGTPLAGNEISSSSNLNLKVVYKNLDDKVINVSSINQGMDFYAEVTVSNPGLQGDYKKIALSQIFPSGWEIRNQRMNLYSSNGGKNYNYQDIRDDRVYTYFDLQHNQSKTFIVNLHATFAGDFYLPSVHVQAMYDNTISAVEKGGKVKVVVPGE